MLTKTIEPIIGAFVFGALGATALAGAVFAGATHQFVTTAICAMMVTVFVAEIRREAKKAKQTN